MLKQDTYISYLESVVLSLLDERECQFDQDIIITDDEAMPSLKGRDVGYYNLTSQIKEQRAARTTI